MPSAIARVQLALLLLLPAIGVAFQDRPWTQTTLTLVAGAWLLVLLGTVRRGDPIPTSQAGRIAVGGLASLAALTCASLSWVGVREPAAAATVLAVLYLGALIAAIPALRPRRAGRLAEPAAALTAFACAAWGMSERLFPSLVRFDHSRIELGRLTQPLGYWNAVGALCGIGLVLATSILSDRERARAARVAAAAAMPTLAAALWLSFSRGALAATLAGLLSLIAIGRSRGRLIAAALALSVFAAAAVGAEALDGVRDISLPLATRTSDGLAFALLLAVITVGASAATAAALRFRRSTAPADDVPLGKAGVRTATVLAAAFALAPFASVVAGFQQTAPPQDTPGADAGRLVSAESLRTDYWRVALRQFESHPAIGPGAGSFSAAWRRHRLSNSPETQLPAARNAHSLPIETLGELGVFGFASLAAFAFGIAISARRASRLDRRLVAGPVAGLIALASHSSIDWDWQVPGLALTGILLAAAVLAGDDAPALRRDAPAARVLTAIAAALVIALSGWMIHSDRLLQQGERVIGAAKLLGWSGDRWERARDLLTRAGRFTPDANPDADLALAAHASGHQRVAIAAARRLVNDNPDSWFAWAILARVSARTEPGLAADAKRHAAFLRSHSPDR